MPTRLTIGWRVCIDCGRLNELTRKDHFPLPFIGQLLERVSKYPFYYFLDGYSRYFQIEITVEDQENSLVHLRLMFTRECLLASAMHLQHSLDVCSAFSVIWWSALW